MSKFLHLINSLHSQSSFDIYLIYAFFWLFGFSFLVGTSWSETPLYYTDQNSSTKFYKILRCQIGPVGPGNWTIKVVPFQRNIQYRARLKGLHFSFSALWKIFSRKGSPFNFFTFCDRMMLKNPKGSSFSAPVRLDFLGTVEKILHALKSFCYFWAWVRRRLMPFLCLFVCQFG